MAQQWLKPSECAARIGHRTTDVVLGAIRDGDLLARIRTLPSGRVRYLVHVDEFDRWFNTVWRQPTSVGATTANVPRGTQ